MTGRIRVGESTSDWEPKDGIFDLATEGLKDLVEKYDYLEDRIKKLVAERDEIKEALKGFGDNVLFRVDGKDKFQVRKDGNFRSADFRRDYPGYFEDFRVEKVEKVFDLERFKKEMPGLYSSYRAHKLVRTNDK